MKARVKATGDIVEISEDCSYVYAEHFDKSYNINELEFLDVKEKSLPNDKDYCDYDTCVALKELGYVGICDAYYELTGSEDYNRDSFELLYTRDFIHPDDVDRVAAPLLYQAQKFLREEKKIIVEVFVDDDSDTPITYNIYKDGECVCHHHGKYWSVKEWSEALSEGIKAAVKILKEE